jgi:hypothetical protein
MIIHTLRTTREFEISEIGFCFSSLKRGDLFVEVESYKNFGGLAPICMKLSKSEKVVVGSQLFDTSKPDALVFQVRKIAD